jgi:hypothetical protein
MVEPKEQITHRRRYRGVVHTVVRALNAAEVVTMGPEATILIAPSSVSA